jgi:hypothetical protein
MLSMRELLLLDRGSRAFYVAAVPNWSEYPELGLCGAVYAVYAGAGLLV